VNYKCIHALLIHGIVQNKLKDNNMDICIVNRVAFGRKLRQKISEQDEMSGQDCGRK
jgi:hypothetical protein